MVGVSIRHLARTFSSQAALSARIAPARAEYKTAQELLESAGLKTVLERNGKSAHDALEDVEVRVAVLAHLAELSGKPVASNAYSSFNSAADMAEWYSEVLRPVSSRGHARNMFMAHMSDRARQDAPDAERNMQVRVDVEGKAVQEEFLSSLPSNVELDPKTFRKPVAPRLRSRGFTKPIVRES